MTTRTKDRRRHPWKVSLALTYVFAWVLGIPLPTLQTSVSVSPSPFASVDQGTIAYVRRSTHDIHLIAPDGSGDRVLWTAPRPLSLNPAHDLAWRPDGRKLAFSSEHEETSSWFQSNVYAIGCDGTGYWRVINSPARAELACLGASPRLFIPFLAFTKIQLTSNRNVF